MTERLRDGETKRRGEEELNKKIRSHRELDTYQMAFKLAMEIYELTKSFPAEEKYSLTDQLRRSSRSVCANLAEAFRKRKYPKAFVAKLSDCESEAAETQVWLDFSMECNYIDNEAHNDLLDRYEQILGKLVNMSLKPEQ
mgnify:CR=1 FL=1